MRCLDPLSTAASARPKRTMASVQGREQGHRTGSFNSKWTRPSALACLLLLSAASLAHGTTPSPTVVSTKYIDGAQAQEVSCESAGCTMEVNFTLAHYEHWTRLFLTVDNVYGDVEFDFEYYSLYVNGTYVTDCLDSDYDTSYQCSTTAPLECVSDLEITDYIASGYRGDFSVSIVAGEFVDYCGNNATAALSTVIDLIPTSAPTATPSLPPTTTPTPLPLPKPTFLPSMQPSSTPSNAPTALPSSTPTPVPSNTPTTVPSNAPVPAPTHRPSPVPSAQPSPAPRTAIPDDDDDDDDQSAVKTPPATLIGTVSAAAVLFILAIIALSVFYMRRGGKAAANEQQIEQSGGVRGD